MNFYRAGRGVLPRRTHSTVEASEAALMVVVSFFRLAIGTIHKIPGIVVGKP